MVRFGGKKVVQLAAGIGGNSAGQLLAAVAVTLLLRVFSGPGPALLPDNNESVASDDDDQSDDVAEGNDSSEAQVDGKVVPVTIRWRNITCSLSDKSSKSVSFLFLFFFELKCILVFNL